MPWGMVCLCHATHPKDQLLIIQATILPSIEVVETSKAEHNGYFLYATTPTESSLEAINSGLEMIWIMQRSVIS